MSNKPNKTLDEKQNTLTILLDKLQMFRDNINLLLTEAFVAQGQGSLDAYQGALTQAEQILLNMNDLLTKQSYLRILHGRQDGCEALMDAIAVKQTEITLLGEKISDLRKQNFSTQTATHELTQKELVSAKKYAWTQLVKMLKEIGVAVDPAGQYGAAIPKGAAAEGVDASESVERNQSHSRRRKRRSLRNQGGQHHNSAVEESSVTDIHADIHTAQQDTSTTSQTPVVVNAVVQADTSPAPSFILQQLQGAFWGAVGYAKQQSANSLAMVTGVVDRVKTTLLDHYVEILNFDCIGYDENPIVDDEMMSSPIGRTDAAAMGQYDGSSSFQEPASQSTFSSSSPLPDLLDNDAIRRDTRALSNQAAPPAITDATRFVKDEKIDDELVRLTPTSSSRSPSQDNDAVHTDTQSEFSNQIIASVTSKAKLLVEDDKIDDDLAGATHSINDRATDEETSSAANILAGETLEMNAQGSSLTMMSRGSESSFQSQQQSPFLSSSPVNPSLAAHNSSISSDALSHNEPSGVTTRGTLLNPSALAGAALRRTSLMTSPVDKVNLPTQAVKDKILHAMDEAIRKCSESYFVDDPHGKKSQLMGLKLLYETSSLNPLLAEASRQHLAEFVQLAAASRGGRFNLHVKQNGHTASATAFYQALDGTTEDAVGARAEVQRGLGSQIALPPPQLETVKHLFGIWSELKVTNQEAFASMVRASNAYVAPVASGHSPS
jgi:hypothetical protein